MEAAGNHTWHHIASLLKQKLLSLNYDKSKYILLGYGKAKNRMRKELMKQLMKMGEERLENSGMEKYLRRHFT